MVVAVVKAKGLRARGGGRGCGGLSWRWVGGLHLLCVTLGGHLGREVGDGSVAALPARLSRRDVGRGEG